MQSVIQEFTIGFYDTSGVFSIYAKQHDTGRKLKFHLCDLDEDYAELLNDDQIIITLREQLPNGKSVPDIPIDLSNVDKEELSVTVPITKDMIQMAGTAICELTFGSLIDETIISTVKFKLIIDEILPVPESGYEREWFDTWTELWVSLKALEYQVETHESERVTNEEERVENETTRTSNEETREANEAARITAEQQRDEAEQAREAAGTGIIDTAHMWANGMAEGYDEPSATNNARAYAMVAQAVSGLFNGTAAEWESLPLSEKQNYRTVVLNDDSLVIYAYNCPVGAIATGGSVSPQVVVPGANIPVRNNEFSSPIKNDDSEYTIDGDYRYKKINYQYSFDSWNTRADGTGRAYYVGDTYSDGVPITMYAQWTETYDLAYEQYYLTVEADEHVDTYTESQWVDKDDSIEVEATAASGFMIKSGTGLVEMNEPKTINIVSELAALKFSSDEAFTLSVTNPGWTSGGGTIEYSLDEGSTWVIWDGSELSRSANQNIYLRGSGNTKISNARQWTFTGKYCTGNIETLLDYQTVANGQHPTMGNGCYMDMFYGCTSLTIAPELPATTLTQDCYMEMFSGCTSLTTAPELPATTLAVYCYYQMFYGCESLTITPELPATTLADNCYGNMFGNCISLTTLPQLPATILTDGCYELMFWNCILIKLSTTPSDVYKYEYRIPILGTGIDNYSLTGMFSGTGGTFTGTPTINTTYYTDHKPI